VPVIDSRTGRPTTVVKAAEERVRIGRVIDCRRPLERKDARVFHSCHRHLGFLEGPKPTLAQFEMEGTSV
jgi:hypothetical protein